MTRENKLALVIGFGLILFVGILVSDHFSAQRFDPVDVTRTASAEGTDPVSIEPVLDEQAIAKSTLELGNGQSALPGAEVPADQIAAAPQGLKVETAGDPAADGTPVRFHKVQQATTTGRSPRPSTAMARSPRSCRSTTRPSRPMPPA